MNVLSAIGSGFVIALLLTFNPVTALAQSHQASAGQATEKTILVMGDSLSAGYGMAAHQGWVALLGGRVAAGFPGWQVVNASISGETSAGGAARATATIARYRPSVVVIELGANDGLRGLPLADLRSNLAQMVEMAQEAKAHVLLIGMQMPPNLGAEYTAGFAHIYQDLANRYNVALLPFLLEPIAHDRTAFQDDNIHPAATAQIHLSNHVWPALRPLIGCTPDTPSVQCGSTSKLR